MKFLLGNQHIRLERVSKIGAIAVFCPDQWVDCTRRQIESAPSEQYCDLRF